VIKAYFAELREQLPTAPLDWENIARAYADRPYHNLSHLDEMLTHLEMHGRDRIVDPTIFALALVYHDIVYKPTRKNNEERSAEAAVEILRSMEGIEKKRVERCHRLIMVTKRHLPTAKDDGDESLLIDLDLAVLAREPAAYDEYATAVRQEFWMIPGFVFRKARIKALNGFLDRDHIYHTQLGRQRYETTARNNLWREIQSLSA
jgi:predicted metal-dependent HD superfamily phosphohydrolase